MEEEETLDNEMLFDSSESSGFGSDVMELGYRVCDIRHLCYVASGVIVVV